MQFHSEVLRCSVEDVIQGYQEMVDFGIYENRQSETWSFYLIEAYHQLYKIHSGPEAFGFSSTFRSEDMSMMWKMKMGSEIERCYQLNAKLSIRKANKTGLMTAMLFSPPAIRQSSYFIIDLPQDYIPDDEDLKFAISIYKTILEDQGYKNYQNDDETGITSINSNICFISKVAVVHGYYNMTKTRENFRRLGVELRSLQLEGISKNFVSK